MHRPFSSATLDAYFQHLVAALRLLLAPDSCVSPEKRAPLREALAANGGVPGLAAVSGLIAGDRIYEPLCGLVGAIWAMHLADVPGGDFGGFARAAAAKLGLGTGASNLFVQSFHQTLEMADPVLVAHAAQPLARRGIQEGLRFPAQSLWRDLLDWGPDVKDAWRKSFQGVPAARQDAAPAVAVPQTPGPQKITAPLPRSKGGRFAARAAA